MTLDCQAVSERKRGLHEILALGQSALIAVKCRDLHRVGILLGDDTIWDDRFQGSLLRHAMSPSTPRSLQSERPGTCCSGRARGATIGARSATSGRYGVRQPAHHIPLRRSLCHPAVWGCADALAGAPRRIAPPCRLPGVELK